MCDNTTPSAAAQLDAPMQSQNCAACSAAIPLENTTDNHFKIHGRLRRVVTHDCPACGRRYTATFMGSATGWQLLGRVQVRTKEQLQAELDRKQRVAARKGSAR